MAANAPTASAYRTPRRELPVLEDLRVAAPCDVTWDSMLGNGRARHCAKCDKDVFNISGMTRAEAQSFLLDRAGGACIRFYRRADGTVMTSDCPVGVRKKRVRHLAVLALGLGAGVAAVAATSTFNQTTGAVPVGPLSPMTTPPDPRLSGSPPQDAPPVQPATPSPNRVMGGVPARHTVGQIR